MKLLHYSAAILAIGSFTLAGALAQTKADTSKYHPKMTAAQAIKAALKKYHGKVVGRVPLENEEGKWEYAVTIRSGKKLREVMVNADTGKIDSVEVTTTKEEAKEAAAENAKAKKKGGGG